MTKGSHLCEELDKPEEQTTQPTYYHKLYDCDTHTKQEASIN